VIGDGCQVLFYLFYLFFNIKSQDTIQNLNVRNTYKCKALQCKTYESKNQTKELVEKSRKPTSLLVYKKLNEYMKLYTVLV